MDARRIRLSIDQDGEQQDRMGSVQNESDAPGLEEPGFET